MDGLTVLSIRVLVMKTGGAASTGSGVADAKIVEVIKDSRWVFIGGWEGRVRLCLVIGAGTILSGVHLSIWEGIQLMSRQFSVGEL